MNATLQTNASSFSDRACLSYLNLSLEAYFAGLHNFSVAAITVNIPLALMAVLGNGLIFVAYYQNESLRKPANTVLVSLAITDFLSGAVSQPLYVYDHFLVLTNRTDLFCGTAQVLKVFSTIFLTGATLLNLSVTTLDRYMAVFHGLRYTEIATKARAVKISASLWFAWTTTIVLAGTFLKTVALIMFVIVLVSNVIFIVILNYRIFRETRRLQGNQVAVANQPAEARKAAERRTAKTVGLIVGLLFLCYVPLVLCFTLFLTTNIRYNIIYHKCLHVALSISLSNSALNVLVYFWKNAEMRLAMLRVFNLHHKFGQNQIAPHV